MPTSGYNFTAQEITVRFRTPYISETLNKQFRGIVSAGVYEGFNPTIAPSPLHILLAVDPSGRSSALAVSALNASTSVGVHLVGDVDLDLSAYFSKTVAVCIDLSYAFPADTTGVINVYDLGSETVPATSCVLAEVVVPAAGLIPAANININNRSFPYLSRGRDATPLVSVVRNGGPFLTHDLVGLPDFFDPDTAGLITFAASSAVLAPSGYNLTIEARKTLAGISLLTGGFLQKIGLPVPANRRLRLSAAYRPVVAPTLGTPILSAVITDRDGNLITTVSLPLDSLIVGVWATYETTVMLPAVTTTAVVVQEVRIDCTGVQFTVGAPNSPIFNIANIDAQLEQAGPATDVLPEISGESHFTKTRHYADAYPGAAYSEITFDGAETLLTSTLPTLSHTFHVNGNLTVDGSTTLGTIFANTLDTPAPVDATSLTVGGTNALSVLIGRALRNTEVKGVLLVGTATNPDSAQLHVLGNETISGTHLRVRSGVGFPFNLTSMTGTGFTYTGGLHTFVGALSQSGGPINLLPASNHDINIKTLQGDITVEVTGAGQIDILTDSNVINIGSSTSDINIFAGGVSLLGGSSGATVWAGNSPPTYVNTLVSIGSELGTRGVSIFAGGPPPLPAVNSMLIGATDDIVITSMGAAGVIQITALGASGDVTIAAGRNASLAAAGTGNATLSASGSGNVTLSTIGGNLIAGSLLGGMVIFVGGFVPPASAGDVLIGNALASGGVSIFAGGTPPAPFTNNLRLGAVSAVAIESTTSGVAINAVGAGITCVAQTIVDVRGLNLAGPFDVSIGTQVLLVGGSVSIDLAGVTSVHKEAVGGGSAEAFLISGCVNELTNDVSPAAGHTWPNMYLLAGRYGFRVEVTYEYIATAGDVHIDMTPASGTTTGNAIDAKTFVGDPVNQFLARHWSAAASVGFTNATSVTGAGDKETHWVEGVIEFSQSGLVTMHATVNGGGAIKLFKGSYFRFFAHRLF